MSGVIANSPLIFCHAEIDTGGYIYIDKQMFHRDMTIDEFTPEIFYSLAEAVDNLPNYDGETFVMAFPEDDTCDRLWFMPEQEEIGLTKRLNTFRMCYGGYPTAIYRKG
jgi:hypothetical protein